MIFKTAPRIANSAELHSFEYICSRVASFCNAISLKQGICVHSPIIKLGLQHNLYINNNLLSIYAKCFGLNTAHQFFDEMPYKDVVTWTGILSGYAKNERHQKAIEIFDLMTLSSALPNGFTFSNVLRSCSALGELKIGKKIHCCVIKSGFESNQIVCCSLIDLYSKFESFDDASKVFSCTIDTGDVVSWTLMISCFVQADKWGRALWLYVDMIKARVSPNEFTFVKLFAACGFVGLKCGKLVHGHMIVLGVEMNLAVKTALVDFYSRWRMMDDAVRVSKLTPEFDVLLWTAIISGLAQNLKFKEAVSAFQNMEVSGILPSKVTYLSMLNVCSSLLSLSLGKQIHSRVVITGLEDDVSIGNALIDFYMKCSGSVEDGLSVFRGINSPSVVTWTSLIAGVAEHGFQEDSFELFMKMRAAGLQPNSFTLSIILKACGMVKSASQASKLHGYIIKTEADHDIVVGNALVDAYARSGKVDDAWQVVKSMRQRDVITYTSLATRLNQTGHHKLILSVISNMLNDDVKMDGFSLASFLSASASLKTMKTGIQLHCLSVKSALGSHISVSNVLVVFYGRCGLVHDAHRAFAEITEPDVVSWNGLISVLASNDSVSSALSAFDDMRLAGVKPDPVTFLSVLSACRHDGLVDMGIEYFHSMRMIHGIEPQLDHYIHLVDLLGQAARLEDAVRVIETMPFRPDAVLYKTLLAACKEHRNVPLGEDIAQRGLELDPSDRTFYLLLANLYDDSGRSDLGDEMRRLMKKIG